VRVCKLSSEDIEFIEEFGGFVDSLAAVGMSKIENSVSGI
jgi:hypothetical protein